MKIKNVSFVIIVLSGFILTGCDEIQKIIDELMLAENTEKLKELGDGI